MHNSSAFGDVTLFGPSNFSNRIIFLKGRYGLSAIFGNFPRFWVGVLCR